jgi:hypothetical protein
LYITVESKVNGLQKSTIYFNTSSLCKQGSYSFRSFGPCQREQCELSSTLGHCKCMKIRAISKRSLQLPGLCHGIPIASQEQNLVGGYVLQYRARCAIVSPSVGLRVIQCNNLEVVRQTYVASLKSAVGKGRVPLLFRNRLLRCAYA